MQIFITEGNFSVMCDENSSNHECNPIIQITKRQSFPSIINNKTGISHGKFDSTVCKYTLFTL